MNVKSGCGTVECRADDRDMFASRSNKSFGAKGSSFSDFKYAGHHDSR